MNFLSNELITQIIDDVFNPFCFIFLNLRIVNRLFNDIILSIIFRSPFKYFKDIKILVCLYIYYINDNDNLLLLTTNCVDLKLIALSYLFIKKVDDDEFKKFANNTIEYSYHLKEFDYYEFICSFCALCTNLNGNFPNLNRFDLYPEKLEKSLQYILKNIVLVDKVTLSTLNIYLETKFENNPCLFWLHKSIKPFGKDGMKSLLNVKRVCIRVDFVDCDAMLILKKLEQVEKVHYLYIYSNIFRIYLLFNTIILLLLLF